MNTLIEGIQNAITYMEENLTEDVSVKKIAEKAYVSEFHFQRVFSALCGFSVGEYIRNRRLALAAQELAASDVKVIDVAVKYGYDSPDSFARAFTKFHGITPSAAKEKGAKLRDFDYLIADNYLPWEEVPAGYETRTLPAGAWAVFPCTLRTLQDTNTRMWKEWLPNCKEYKLGGNYNIEMYGPPLAEDPGSSYVELWLPIEKVK